MSHKNTSLSDFDFFVSNYVLRGSSVNDVKIGIIILINV